MVATVPTVAAIAADAGVARADEGRARRSTGDGSCVACWVTWTGRTTPTRRRSVSVGASVTTRCVVNEPTTPLGRGSSSWRCTGKTPAGNDWHCPPSDCRWIVKGAEAVGVEVPEPTTTGMGRSTPPGASPRPATWIGDDVAETGAPSAPDSDWSNPDTLDRHE